MRDLMLPPSTGGAISFKQSEISQASAVTRASHNLWDTGLCSCGRMVNDTETGALEVAPIVSMDGDDDTGAWVLLAQTRTVKVLGKRLAGREAQVNEPNADLDCHPSQAVRERVDTATGGVVVASGETK